MCRFPAANLRIERIDPTRRHPDYNLVSTHLRTSNFRLAKRPARFFDHPSSLLHRIHPLILRSATLSSAGDPSATKTDASDRRLKVQNRSAHKTVVPLHLSHARQTLVRW